MDWGEAGVDQRDDGLPEVNGPLVLSPEALRAANINPATGLATDYLNHFNEITMLLGLVPDMPEVMDEIRAWCPSSYEQHFARSGFTGRALAIAAYRATDPAIRTALDETVASLEAAIGDVVAALDAAPPEVYPGIVACAEAEIRPLMGRASAIIHGVEADDALAFRASQPVVDALMG
jgi:hypothetical protein